MRVCVWDGTGRGGTKITGEEAVKESVCGREEKSRQRGGIDTQTQQESIVVCGIRMWGMGGWGGVPVPVSCKSLIVTCQRDGFLGGGGGGGGEEELREIV